MRSQPLLHPRLAALLLLLLLLLLLQVQVRRQCMCLRGRQPRNGGIAAGIVAAHCLAGKHLQSVIRPLFLLCMAWQ